MVRVLELFKGTGSITNYLKETNPDYEVISLDILKKYNPTITSDILTWDYKIYPQYHFDIIWASPECKIFSSLQHTNIGRKWESMEDLNNARKTNWCFPLKVLEIIEYFKPKVYFIENPYYSAMKDIEQMKLIKSFRFDYCAFGYKYKKPTRIWSNLELKEKLCSCEGHDFRLGISNSKNFNKKNTQKDKTTLNERYSIPQDLLNYLFNEAKLLL
ncbi:putative cytosine DNA methyltransferase [Chrysochromulina parva virophage Moe]|nr:putative cytosine DNA methyltransferase [Chrysochromulina parva virophage Moe]